MTIATYVGKILYKVGKIRFIICGFFVKIKLKNLIVAKSVYLIERRALLVINVVIADDDYIVRTGLLDMIPWEKLGANVVAALENGEQVIKLLEENPNIDLMILDIRMPILDGLSVAKHVREHGYEAEIVLLSAHAEFSYACDALKYDIREYLLKPISRAKLNKLSEVIQSVSEEKDDDIRWRLYLRDKSLQEEVKNILSRQDMEALDTLLDTESRFGQVSVKKLKEYGAVLLGMRQFGVVHRVEIHRADIPGVGPGSLTAYHFPPHSDVLHRMDP